MLADLTIHLTLTFCHTFGRGVKCNESISTRLVTEARSTEGSFLSGNANGTFMVSRNEVEIILSV
jgi:hypothetical protein